MTKREREIYRAGLLDELRDRPSLVPVLAIADQKKLLIAYGEGVMAGRQLKTDDDEA